MGYVITIVLVYLFCRYGEAVLDVYFEVFKQKKTLRATELNCETTALNCELGRKYPELSGYNDGNNVIGYNTHEDYSDMCDPDDCEDCDEDCGDFEGEEDEIETNNLPIQNKFNDTVKGKNDNKIGF